MIRRSFIMLPRVGPITEQKIWAQGIDDWDRFQEKQRIEGINPLQKARHDRFLSIAKEHLYGGDSAFFKSCLSSMETWRLYSFFRDEAVFLDIETSFAGDITIVGCFDGIESKTMVKGINLDGKTLGGYLKRFKLIVTFNGASFDLVHLQKYYPGCIPDIPHIDLRYACRKLGLSGGLKLIEKKIGIARDDEVVNAVGGDAPLLWRYFKATGDDHYLRLLIKYNDEDASNLRPLADHVVDGLTSQLKALKK
jgi:uncharacterized protein